MPALKKLPLDRWISYRFGLIATRMGAVMADRYVSKHDLPMPAWRSLAVIARFGPMSAGELGAKTSSDPYRVVRAIDLLVNRGLITRETDPGDRRKARLEVTPEGRALYREIEKGAISNEHFIRAELTDADVQALEAILDKIESRVQRLPQQR